MEKTSGIVDYADKWGRPAMKNYAAELYRDWELDGVRELLENGPDEITMTWWGMNEEEWREAVEAAIFEMEKDL